MVRDIAEDKIDYSLVLDGPMFERDAIHLTNGAKKYDKRNWMKASTHEELNRFRESALRHFIQWFRGDRDEDHAAAVRFNINGAEYVRDRLDILTPDPIGFVASEAFSMKVPESPQRLAMGTKVKVIRNLFDDPAMDFTGRTGEIVSPAPDVKSAWLVEVELDGGVTRLLFSEDELERV